MLLLTTVNVFAMNENTENYRTRAIVIQNGGDHSCEHDVFVDKITRRLHKAQEALKTDAVDTRFNININVTAAHYAFFHWLNLFEKSNNKHESKEFVPKIRKLFVEFKDVLDHQKVSGNYDYPATHRHTFALNLRIQKLTDTYSGDTQ
jgi:acyl-homoserine lactone acylase PvdQ